MHPATVTTHTTLTPLTPLTHFAQRSEISTLLSGVAIYFKNISAYSASLEDVLEDVLV